MVQPYFSYTASIPVPTPRLFISLCFSLSSSLLLSLFSQRLTTTALSSIHHHLWLPCTLKRKTQPIKTFLSLRSTKASHQFRRKSIFVKTLILSPASVLRDLAMRLHLLRLASIFLFFVFRATSSSLAYKDSCR